APTGACNKHVTLWAIVRQGIAGLREDMRAAAATALASMLAACSVVRIGAPAQLDVNAADAGALAALPGLTREDGERIVENRPYVAKDDLLRRAVLTPTQYAAVADRVYVGPPGTPDYLRAVPPQP